MVSRKEPARQRWFDSAVSLLNDREDIDRLLTVDRICDRDGRQSQTFHEQFHTLENFMNELIDYIFQANREPLTYDINEVLLAIKDAEQLLDAARAFLEMDFNTVRDLSDNGVIFTLMGGNPVGRIGSGLRQMHHTLDDDLAPILDEVLAAWNREPIPPMTSTDLAVIFNSFADGMAMRLRFDPEKVQASLYVNAVLCWIPALTRKKGESITIDDRIAEIDSYEHQ